MFLILIEIFVDLVIIKLVSFLGFKINKKRKEENSYILDFKYNFFFGILYLTITIWITIALINFYQS